MKDMKVPFDRKRNTYLGYPDMLDSVVWIDNHEFIDNLYYEDYSRGRSSVKFEFRGRNDTKYEMFLSDFHEAITAGHFNDNEIYGVFTFVKRGKNYGVAPVCVGRDYVNSY